jgi:integral membrane protein (TIGR00529 family)
MFDILKIALVFTAILVFLRLKWNIGNVLLLASGLLSLLYLMPAAAIISTIKSTVTDTVTIKLFFALTLIRMLEMILREKQVLAKMMEALRNILKKKKAVIISMPMLIGLLPSLGGAYFSAPMVDESTKDIKMSAEEKGFINYWFRHPWEYILPLYPGILLASAITKLELRSLILANMPYAVLILITGFLFSMRNIHSKAPEVSSKRSKKNGGLQLFWSFLPLIFILIMVIALNVELHYALAITVLMLFVFYKFTLKDISRTFAYGFTLDVIVIVFGTMLFKFTMENSGAVVHLSNYFTEKEIPLLPILFALPFISGLLTGLTVGFVGSTFPLILSIAGGAHLNQITFAFASGFAGVLLSPVHLCFVLTREYFKADISGIYRKTIPCCIIIMAGAFVVYFIL